MNVLNRIIQRFRAQKPTTTIIMTKVKLLSPAQFSRMLKNPEIKNLQVIDVREANELSMAKLHDNRMVNLPLSGINDWLSKLAHGTMLHKTAPTVVYCHHGIRSMNAATHIVDQAHFTEVYSLDGGIHAYAEQVDPSCGFY